LLTEEEIYNRYIRLLLIIKIRYAIEDIIYVEYVDCLRSMNRRNFVVGLGTVATISGVASVTAASFADSIEAGANFQAIVDEEVTLRIGDGVPDDGDFSVDGNGFTDTDLTDDSGHEGLTADDFDSGDGGALAHFADRDSEPINDEIEIGVAVLNDDEEVDGDADNNYEEFLEIDNEGASEQEIGIRYIYGDDVDNEGLSDEVQGDDGESGDVDPDDVVELFTFVTDDGGDQISPDDGDVEEPNSFTAEPGEHQINLEISLDDDLAGRLADAADVDDGIFDDDGVNENLDLLDAIEVGVLD